MIPHLVLVIDVLTILPWIEFEGPVTEPTLNCAIELHRVLWYHDEAFFVVGLVHRLVFEDDYAAQVLLHAVTNMDDVIRLVEVGELPFDFVSGTA